MVFDPNYLEKTWYETSVIRMKWSGHQISNQYVILLYRHKNIENTVIGTDNCMLVKTKHASSLYLNQNMFQACTWTIKCFKPVPEP